jgi:hypothetical protein
MLLAAPAVTAEEQLKPLTNGALGITHGAHIRPVFLPNPPGSIGPEDYGYGKEILNFNDLVGKDIGVVMYFDNWNKEANDHAFDDFLLLLINYEISDPSRRPAVMLTWSPTRDDWGGGSFGCTKSYSGGNAIPPQDIIDGVCDTYIQIFRDDLKAHPDQRFLLRFGHEMNIYDSKWWPGHWAPDASLYVDAYQHIYDLIMVEPGAPTNVEWVWSPNYASNPPDAWNAIPNYYPGDPYVDWIGLSGYNWYTDGAPDPWRTFEFLYDDVLTDLTCRYAKPQIIAEFGTVEGAGPLSKQAWITDAYQRVQDFPFVRSVIWFNDFAYENPAEADFRVTTGSAHAGIPDYVTPLPSPPWDWTVAYMTAIADPTFTSSLPSLAAATPPFPICTELFLPIIMK